MTYRSKIHKSRTKILGRFQTRMVSIRGHTVGLIPLLRRDGALIRILVNDGVTGLFYVKRGCQFRNAVSYWPHSRQNCHFGHILAKCGKMPV